ncbi:MAG: hypothetical protein LBK13_02525 [Spirochaetales bacterium]|jgi:hypothetical protein|nr:hypothetical protein [Spirochaetales bacterium]
MPDWQFHIKSSVQNWAHFWAAPRRPKNRAFRSKSSELPMQFLWAFRFNPLRRAAAAQNRFAILRQPGCMGEQPPCAAQGLSRGNSCLWQFSGLVLKLPHHKE